jgi:hypothetical protein
MNTVVGTYAPFCIFCNSPNPRWAINFCGPECFKGHLNMRNIYTSWDHKKVERFISRCNQKEGYTIDPQHFQLGCRFCGFTLTTEPPIATTEETENGKIIVHCCSGKCVSLLDDYMYDMLLLTLLQNSLRVVSTVIN